jgi:hypothetical protein
VATECLTDDELATLRDTAPGSAPAGLAQHLAGCERCQARALFGAVRSPGLRREPPQLPSLGRALGLLAIVLLALVALLWTLGRLVGR